MAIIVVGGGAIGLLVAGKLVQSGQNTAVLARPRVAEIFNSNHLCLTQQEKTLPIAGLTVVSDLSHLSPCFRQADLAILCVKGYDTTNALSTLKELDPKLILTLQNGIGNEEILAAHLGADRVLSGAITSSVEPNAPHHITVTKSGGIGLAPVGRKPDIAHWSAVFTRAGFKVQTYEAYRALKWSKALLNMLGNATSAILDMSVEEIYADARLVAMERQAFLETVAVMRKLGVQPVNLPAYPAALLTKAMQQLPFPVLLPVLRRAIAGGRGGKAPSLQRDMQQGRDRTEGEYLYGAIARTASHIGMVAPVNAVLWYVLQGIVTGTLSHELFQRNPQRLLALTQM